jgi:hypothetical protein
MTFKTYLWGIRFISLISLAALAVIITYISPENSGTLGILLFYIIAFFMLTGIFNLFLLFVRRKLLGIEAAADNINLSFRQGMLLSLATIGILILQNFRMLIWWDALLVVAGIFLIELYFLSRG